MMTKKDFEMVAAVIVSVHATLSTGADGLDPMPIPRANRVCNRMAEEMADTLARTNPRFDRDRFLKACQPKGDK